MDRPIVFDSILVEFHALDKSSMLEEGGRYVATPHGGQKRTVFLKKPKGICPGRHKSY